MRRRTPPAVRYFLILLGGSSLLVAASASAQTTLRWRFEPGKAFQQTIIQDMKSSTAFGGQTMDTTVTQTIDAVWEVGEVDAQGTAAVTQEIKRIRMKLGAPGGMGFDLDSASDAEPQGLAAAIAPGIKAMAKARFTMKMTALGEILEVELSQETLDALKALPNAGQLGGLFSKDTLVNMIKQGTPALPKEPVTKGKSWTNTMEVDVPQLGKMATKTKLTYLGSEEVGGKSLEKIGLTATTSIGATAGAAAGQQVTLKDQSAQGTSYFDNKAGRFSHSQMLQNMTLQVAVANQNIEQKIQQTIKVQLVPAKP